MTVDTSALAAIFFQEQDGDCFLTAIQGAPTCRMSAATLVETAMVLGSQLGPPAIHEFDAFVRRARIAVEPVSPDQAYLARQAFLDFGKGRHPAGLNFGDCFAYALAKITGDSLLFKGRNFSRTDLVSAL